MSEGKTPPESGRGEASDPLDAPLAAWPTAPRKDAAGMTAASRERSRASFRELVRLANATSTPGPVTPPQSGPGPSSGDQDTRREESAGVIQLAALGAANHVAGAAPPPRTENPGKTNRSWVGIGSVVAAAALAVGVFLGVRHVAREEGPRAVATIPSLPQPGSAQPLPGAAVAPAAPAVPVAPVADDDRGTDPATLPAAPAQGVAALGSAASGLAPRGSVLSSAPRTATAPANTGTVPAATTDPSASASLQTLMQQAAGVTSVPASPAIPSPAAPPEAVASVPLQPSQGAVQGALGAALPSARACLDPDDAISRATVTFGSDGSVVNVGVSGGAAGKAAEGCIRAALMKARVAPFARPTFTGTATVRPN